MRSVAGLAVVLGCVFPASATAENKIAVAKVSYTGYVPYVEVSGTVDPACATEGCRWYPAIRVAPTAEACAGSTETPWQGGLQQSGGSARPFSVRYPTSNGARPEVACLVVFDTDSETTRVVAWAAYDVPPDGQTWTPPPGSPAGSGSSPAPAGSAPSPGAARPGGSGVQGTSDRAFSRAMAGAKLNRALRKRFGRRWTRARSRSVSCIARSIRTFRCTAKFGGRTVRANVTRKRVTFVR